MAVVAASWLRHHVVTSRGGGGGGRVVALTHGMAVVVALTVWSCS
jgi:hypothetical protein